MAQPLRDQLQATLGEAFAEGFTFHEGHGIPEVTAVSAGVVHGEDVRMLEAGGDFDLALKPRGTQRYRQLRMEHLEGD